MPLEHDRSSIIFCKKCLINASKSLLASKKCSDVFLKNHTSRVSAYGTKINAKVKYTKLSSKSQSYLKFCVWNAQSLGNKMDLVHDYRVEHDLDLMLFTESWLKLNDTAEIGQLENFGQYNFITQPRNQRKGGGIGCLYKSKLMVKKLESPIASKSFEHLVLSLEISGKHIIILLIYRPEPSAKNRYTMSEFFNDFSQLLANYHCSNQELLITGDFNLHINKPNLPNVLRFNEILETFGLVQHIKGPTHIGGNTLDLVITRGGSKILKDCKVDELLSDHNAILMEVDAKRPKPTQKLITFRKTKKINLSDFKKDLSKHLMKSNLPGSQQGHEYLNSLIRTYDSCTEILDKHAPLQQKMVTERNITPWNSEDIRDAKVAKRRAEKRWRKNKSRVNQEIFKEKRNLYNNILKKLRAEQLRNNIQKNKGNSKALFKIVNSALNRKSKSPMPPHDDDKQLASDFSKFFDD